MTRREGEGPDHAHDRAPLDEAMAESSHKAYCDVEMAEAKEKMGDLQTAIEKLNTMSDSKTAQIGKRKEVVAELQGEQAARA